VASQTMWQQLPSQILGSLQLAKPLLPPPAFNWEAADSAGIGVAADYAYFRITNLDDTNFVTLRLYNGADSFWYKLAAGESLMLMNNEMDAATGTTFGALADITSVLAQADTATCDVEFIAVTA